MTNVVTQFISRSVIIGALLLIAVGASEVRAQQTIFNVPSANTAERGSAFVEWTSAFRSWGTDYNTHLPRVTVGVGKGVELSGAVETNGQRFGDTTTLQLAGKWRFYHNEETGTALAASSQISIPLRGQPEKGSVLTFAGLHQTIKPTGTRLSGGASRMARPARCARTILWGAGLRFEQPVYKGLSAIGDWVSGNNHRLGAFTPGISYAKGQHYVRAGYQIFNQDRTRNGVMLRYGFWF